MKRGSKIVAGYALPLLVFGVFSLPSRAGDVVRVSVNTGGKQHHETAGELEGYVRFDGLSVDATRSPIVQVRAEGTQGPWQVLVGEHGGSLKKVHRLAGDGMATINLYGALGWRGRHEMDVLVQLKEDIRVVHFDLSGVVDKDLVMEDDKKALASRFGENEESLQCFVEEGRYDSGVKANGMPANRRVPAADKELGEYVLLPYDRLNALEISIDASAVNESHMVNVPDHRYSKLGFLTASQGGDTSYTLILHYKDGSATTNWVEADDWYRRSRTSNTAVLKEMDWAICTDGAVEDTDHFHLYEFVSRDIDRTRVLDMIAIGNDPHRWPDGENRYAAVFAINGRAAIFPEE